ncbi:hypothetical protein BC629DRAFT_1157360 [Irpex lacteus]|nr:hypothetical protein BC629DRAFT_1157360 [Irpex lacteus]
MHGWVLVGMLLLYHGATSRNRAKHIVVCCPRSFGYLVQRRWYLYRQAITHHAARIFYEIVQRETSFTRIAFVKETVPLVIGMENSSEVVRRVLSAPGKELLSHWSLHITLTIALLILRGSRPEKSPKRNDGRHSTHYIEHFRDLSAFR